MTIHLASFDAPGAASELNYPDFMVANLWLLSSSELPSSSIREWSEIHDNEITVEAAGGTSFGSE